MAHRDLWSSKKIEDLTTKTFELKPFSDDEIQRLFEKYKAFYSMEGVELRLPVLEVCRNPLHMRMLFEVYQPNEIPEDFNIQKLYDRYWENKVGKIGGRLQYLRELEKNYIPELKDKLTKKIAVEMLKKKEIFLEEKYVKEGVLVSSYVEQQATISESENPNVFQFQEVHQASTTDWTLLMNAVYNNLLDESVLRVQEETVEFFHQSFFEYAAARALIENDEKKLLKDLCNNITSLENKAIIEQIILYAKRKKDHKTALKFLGKLSKTNLYTKIIAIDLLKHIENITEKDGEIYLHLAEDGLELKKYLAKSLKTVVLAHYDLGSALSEKLIADDGWHVRAAVARVIPEICNVNPELATRLSRRLSKDDNKDVRSALARGLRLNQEMAIHVIKKLSKDNDWRNDWRVRRVGARVIPGICNVDPELATRLMKELSGDRNAYVKEGVALALPDFFNVDPKLSTDLIEKLSADYSWPVRVSVVRAVPGFFNVNPKLATTLIKKLSNETDGRVLMGIAHALPELFKVLNPEQVTLLIEKIVKYKRTDLRKIVVRKVPELFKMDPGRANRLVKNLRKSKYPRVQGIGALTLPELFKLNPELITAYIRKNSRATNPDVRLGVARTIPKLFTVDPALATTLTEDLCKDPEGYVRRMAAQALTILFEDNPALAAKLINKLCKDNDWRVRKATTNSLPELFTVDPALAATLTEDLCKDPDWHVRMRIAKILPELFLEDAELATSLIEDLCNDTTEEVRANAAVTFLMLAELYPSKARALIEKLKYSEDMNIQSAIKDITERSLNRGVRKMEESYLFQAGDKRNNNTQVAEIKGSKKVKTKQISHGGGNQKLRVVDSEYVEHQQIIEKGEEKGKIANSSEISETESSRNNELLYWSELISEICDIFKSVYQKYREKGESDVNSKTLAFLKHKLHDLAASRRPFKWLDVGCGYGRALDVLDAVDMPGNIFGYHGIDAVHKYLDDAERQAKKHELANPKIEKMDAAQMDFDSEFDLVSAVLLLHEVDPLCLPYIIKNMLHALKPDGTLVISDFQGPYEQEEEIVAWSAEDIERLVENICDEAKVSFEPMPADKYPKELGFYACYVKKSRIEDKKFETFMENYHEFLENKKNESRNMRNELRRQIKERVEKILGRSEIDTKNISDKEMERIKGEIGDEYGIKAYKIRLLNNQIDFLDCKIQDFKRGNRCGGLR